MIRFLEHLVISIWNHWQGRRKRLPKDSAGMVTLGFRVVEGQVTNRPVQLSASLLSRHTALFGKSGSGKTSLIKSELGQLATNPHRGAFILDLHGDLTPFLLSTLASEERRQQVQLSDRVIVISPSDREMSVGLNPLEGIGNNFSLAAEMAEVLRQQAHLDYLGPRTEEVLRNTVVVLAANCLTLLEMGPLLTDSHFRAKCLANTPNAEVCAYFESRYDKASEAMKATIREPILNKISSLTADPRFRHIVGQSQSTFSMKDAMDSGRFVIAHLPKGELGAQALTFASLLVTAVKNAIFTRERKSLFTLFLDEAQNLVSKSSDVEVMLSESRKFGVGVVAANQFLDQYPASMRTAILSVANLVCFQLSSVDAATMAQILDGGKPLAERIKNLPQRHFILKSNSDRWVEACVPNVETPKTSYADLLQRSRTMYARPRAEIERDIAERHVALAKKTKEVSLNDWD